MAEQTNESTRKQCKLTLNGYYNQLPEASHPRTEFLNDLAFRAGVSLQTVRNWVIYGMRPNKRSNIDLLVEKTGIPEEMLWEK